jgi:hypothetical protein
VAPGAREVPPDEPLPHMELTVEQATCPILCQMARTSSPSSRNSLPPLTASCRNGLAYITFLPSGIIRALLELYGRCIFDSSLAVALGSVSWTCIKSTCISWRITAHGVGGYMDVVQLLFLFMVLERYPSDRHDIWLRFQSCEKVSKNKDGTMVSSHVGHSSA